MVPCCKTLHTATVTSPIGNLQLICCSKGVHAISQASGYADIKVPDPCRTVEPVEGYDPKIAPMAECVDWLKAYFEKPSNIVPRPHVCRLESPTTFMERTWKVLAEQVPSGSTVSYGKLAQIMNNPQAARAVGTAMSKNEVLLIVPCHRVIRSSGEIGVYAMGRGNHVKKWLLQHEGFTVA